MLDSNVLSDLIRHPRTSPAVARIAEVGQDAVCTSPFVACEMRYGARKKGSARLETAVDELLRRMTIAELDGTGFPRIYAEVRTVLERAGRPIGAVDLLIASHALCVGAIMVTDNRREFDRVEGLRVESWT
ncbi:MAG: PIN domain-containing protein [Salinarimonas sp.]